MFQKSYYQMTNILTNYLPTLLIKKSCKPSGPEVFRGLILVTACKIFSSVASRVSHFSSKQERSVDKGTAWWRAITESFLNLLLNSLENTCKITFWSSDQIPRSSMIFHIKFFPFVIVATIWKYLVFLSPLESRAEVFPSLTMMLVKE